MIQKINEYREGNHIVEQYSKDGKIVSHVVRKLSYLYYLRLETDKNTVLANGKDYLVITASILNLDDEVQSEWQEDIVFMMNEETLNVPVNNGIATMNFSSDLVGEFTITATTPNCSDSDVKVVVVYE